MVWRHLPRRSPAVVESIRRLVARRLSRKTLDMRDRARRRAQWPANSRFHGRFRTRPTAAATSTTRTRGIPPGGARLHGRSCSASTATSSRKPVEVMENFQRVTSHLAAKPSMGERQDCGSAAGAGLDTAERGDGRMWHLDAEGYYWRGYSFIEGRAPTTRWSRPSRRSRPPGHLAISRSCSPTCQRRGSTIRSRLSSHAQTLCRAGAGH